MDDTSPQTFPPTTTPTTPHPKLRWYQFHLSSLLWFTVVVALLVGNVMMRGQLSTLERQIEKIKQEGAMPELTPGCITQVSFGPGMHFRGDLPEGEWRLALYFWNGKTDALDILMADPPKDTPPLIAIPLPTSKSVHIDVSEIRLPSDTMHDGKIAKYAYEFNVYDERPGFYGAAHYSESVLLSSDFEISTNPPRSRPCDKGVHLWNKSQSIAEVSTYLSLKIEPINEKSLSPQLNSAFYLNRIKLQKEGGLHPPFPIKK